MRLPAWLASASVGHQGPLGQSPLTPGRPKKKCERARGLPGGFPPPDAASSSKSLQLPGVSHVWNSFLCIATPPLLRPPVAVGSSFRLGSHHGEKDVVVVYVV